MIYTGRHHAVTIVLVAHMFVLVQHTPVVGFQGFLTYQYRLRFLFSIFRLLSNVFYGLRIVKSLVFWRIQHSVIFWREYYTM